MRSPEILSKIGKTALVVAAARASESRRPDRLFDDPWAAAFVEAGGGMQAPWLPTQQGVVDYLAIRTRFLDDFLAQATTIDGCHQVLLLAAGLDTRAFRLPWPPGVCLFELDRTEIFGFKEPVLAEQHATPVCQRVTVTADLTEDWTIQLAGTGFEPKKPTTWLVEGVLIYLSEVDSDRVLAQLSRLSAPGSQLAIEHVGRAMLQHSPALRTALNATGTTVIDHLAELWKSTGATDAETWLATHGWRPRTHDVGDLAAHYGRPTPPAFDPQHPRAARGGFLTAHR